MSSMKTVLLLLYLPATVQTSIDDLVVVEVDLYVSTQKLAADFPHRAAASTGSTSLSGY